MKCRKCQSEVSSPVIKYTRINSADFRSEHCPVCGVDLEGPLKSCLPIVVIFIVSFVIVNFFL